MPAKFAATPEKVVRAERIQRGVPSLIAAYAISRPSTPPISAVTMLISMLLRNACRNGWWKSVSTLSNVKPPRASLKAPIVTSPAGTSRKSAA
jgi:hypothetical protein